MAGREHYAPRPQAEVKTIPFMNAEEAWFWFVQAMQAREDGARFAAGAGLYPRPCEPLDILKILDRLYRKRELLWDHILVLRHYGRRMMPPDCHRIRERRAHKLWIEALGMLELVFVGKGIVSLPMEYVQAAE